jgi:hypothetical protein
MLYGLRNGRTDSEAIWLDRPPCRLSGRWVLQAKALQADPRHR